MKNLKYEILQKNISNVKLISLTEQSWVSWNNEVIPWSGSYGYIGPNQNDVVYNVSGSLIEGYYKWSGTTWNNIQKYEAYDNYQLPIFLENSIDEMGLMIDFDGDVEQIEQLCNFTYTATGNTLEIFNTTNTNKLNVVIDATFIINWGDNTETPITILGNASHTYATSGQTNVQITMNSPWNVQTLTKKIYLPLSQNDPTDLGTLVFDIPYSNITGATQNYNNTYDYDTDEFSGTTTFFAIGSSRLIEKKLYGGNTYSGTTSGTTTIDGTIYTYTGYTLDNLNYYDLSDGTTYISGNTVDFQSEAQFVNKLTRNEHYLGFVFEPKVYSDIFIERGKMSATEFNFKLSEIDNIGELSIYGNGFFIVKKV